MDGETKTYSIVEYFGYQPERECGYCKSKDTNCNHGMWAHYLSVNDYQDLIDRGWRRSGHHCYKPTMDGTCCPMYTIRCDALNFRLSKSQKKIIKRMAKFLSGKTCSGSGTTDKSKNSDGDNIERNNIETKDYEKHCARAQKDVSKVMIEPTSSAPMEESTECETTIGEPEKKTKENDEKSLGKKSNPRSGEGRSTRGTVIGQPDPNRPPPKKAKLIRVERKQKKLLAQGKSPEEIGSLFNANRQNVKTIEDFFKELEGCEKKLQTKLVRVMSQEFYESLDASAALYKKYQMAIHKSEPGDCGKSLFLSFLAKSPLQKWCPRNGPPEGYGSFHEQYWLNDQLIAVAVIDILPSCVSSVYFFYDPDYSFLSLGTFSALREVCLTRQLNKSTSDIKYYYMGYYVHSNAKMRYKAKIGPSELLCPETYVWCDIARSIAKIDVSRYSRLNEDMDAIDQDAANFDIEKVKVLNHRRALTYGSYDKRTAKQDETVKEYGQLVGAKCSQSMLLFLS